MKYFILAGEASGDLHASNLVKALRDADPSAEVNGWGGDRMKAQGVEIRKHISELSFMGFAEVLKNIRTIRNNFKECYRQIDETKPDALILVDFPGFNLRVAKAIFGKVPKVYYYISPTVWAWHRSRIYTVRDYTTKMFAILPFEKEFYARFGISVHYEGHPLLDAIEPGLLSQKIPDHGPIALFPGSRRQEISAILPVMLEAAKKVKGSYSFVLAAAPNIPDDYYQQLLGGFPATLSREGSHAILLRSCAAMVTSGTATLETGLIGVPQIVCYTTSPLSYRIARMLVNVKYISLVNLILDEPLVCELIQGNLTAAKLLNELERILPGGDRRETIFEGYRRLHGKIGEPGASRRIANIIYQDLCAH